MPRRSSSVRRLTAAAVTALTAAASGGCADRTATLAPVTPSIVRPAVAAVRLGGVEDRRDGDRERLGGGTDPIARVGYDVVADGALAPWLESHIRGALAEQGLGGAPGRAAAEGAPVPSATLRVRLVGFDVSGSPWVAGRATYDVTLAGADGARSERLVVETTELLTDDGDLAWSHAVAHLGAWSGTEIARWARASIAR